ncbi:hypothetical protein [Streptomyces sp. R08]|uniref:Uncharacterized protein n=1 Tax=Streptomyces sp. R08 TaxID=3238624 RepID=A0AB39LYS1_9ACTN
MQSESAIENPAPARGRRRKAGNGSAEGPVFVDNSGRRSKVLRRIGLLMGAVCLGYAFVLGMAFMGWGISLNPSSLLPFGGGQAGSAPGGGYGPDGGRGGVAPSGAPTGAPTDIPSGTPTGAAPSSSATAH